MGCLCSKSVGTNTSEHTPLKSTIGTRNQASKSKHLKEHSTQETSMGNIPCRKDGSMPDKTDFDDSNRPELNQLHHDSEAMQISVQKQDDDDNGMDIDEQESSADSCTQPLPIQRVESESMQVVEQKKEDPNGFKEGENVRCQVVGCTTWLSGTILDILEDGKCRVRIHRGIQESIKLLLQHQFIHIIDVRKIKKDSIRAKRLSASTNIETDLVDFYLNGRNCQSHLKQLTDSILDFYDREIMRFKRLMQQSAKNKEKVDVYEWDRLKKSKISYAESRMIAIEVLEYCFAAAYSCRIFCLWCEDREERDKIMERNLVRCHLIEAGAQDINNWDGRLSLIAFCDECNTELNDDDYTYRCMRKEHDICLECLWKYKLQHIEVQDAIWSAVTHLDQYSVQCISDYVIGGIRQFDHVMDEENDNNNLQNVSIGSKRKNNDYNGGITPSKRRRTSKDIDDDDLDCVMTDIVN